MNIRSINSYSGQRRRANWFGLAAAGWIGVVCFSSSSMAGRWCDRAFAAIYRDAVYLNVAGNRGLLRSVHPIVHLLAEKSVHLGLFFIFATLFWKSTADTPKKAPLILVFGLLLGVLAEFLQRFAPGRDPAGRDVAIDFAGAALGVVLCLALGRPRPGTPRPIGTSTSTVHL